MSGGSWDYICYKVSDAGDRLRRESCPHRQALGWHLKDIADALHDIEWVDSADKSPGDEIPSIMKCINAKDVLHYSVNDAKKMIEKLENIIKEYS